MIKNVLSKDILFEQILKNIPKTIQNAEIKNSEILGENRGDISSRNNILQYLQRIKKLLSDIEFNYSLGRLKEKEQLLSQLTEKIEIQKVAKKHHAYMISKEIDEKKKNLVVDEDLEVLRDDINSYERAETQIDQWNTEFNNKKQIIQNFEWLEQSVRTWETLGLETAKKPFPFILIITFVLFFIGIITALLRIILDFKSKYWYMERYFWNLISLFLSGRLRPHWFLYNSS